MTTSADSPWIRSEETSEERAQRLQAEGAEPEAHSVVFRGPAHVVTVVIHTYDTDKQAINGCAIDVLGECVAAARKMLKDADSTLNVHAISTDPKAILTQKVKLVLGEVELYAKASSNDVQLATDYALDRLSGALRELAGRHPKFAAFLEENDVTIARSSKV